MKAAAKFLAIMMIIAGGLLLISGKDQKELLNPLAKLRQASTNENKILRTVGFLPAWMAGKTNFYGKEIDELIFAGVAADENGNLVWDSQSKKINNSDYLKIKDNIRQNGGINSLSVTMFEDEKIDKLIANASAVNNLVEQMKQTEKENNFDGINIDFEFMNDQTAVLDDQFVEFIKAVKRATGRRVSVDIFANTINKGDEDRLKSLIGSADEVIVMAYDYHRPGSDNAGPVAPINADSGDHYILETVSRLALLNIDKNKVTFAIPLYGYEWKTKTDNFGAKVKRGWYQMASIKRTKEMENDGGFVIYDMRGVGTTMVDDIKEGEMRLFYDEMSQSPWMVFKTSGEIHQVYYENEQSLKAKIELLRQNQFKSVGFWALGYEGNGVDLDKLVNQ
ncbi:MAG TPA: glycosyl hydrolase family 18 protein [Patescibacteria group bacterium]